MVFCGEWPVGICTWSMMRKGENGLVPMCPNGMGQVFTALGVEQVHLALAPALDPVKGSAYLAAVKRQGWKISAAMMSFDHEDYTTLETIKKTGGIAPDDKWPASGEAFAQAAEIAAKLGTEYISLHAGFLDESDAVYAKKFADRVRWLADRAKENGLTLLLETGQETAEDLLRFLDELNHSALALNFDPANLILYGKGDPCDALKVLAPRIRHLHAKDALHTAVPGTWGMETPWGEGDVNIYRFLRRLEKAGYKGSIAVEREGGETRVKDIALALKRLQAF